MHSQFYLMMMKSLIVFSLTILLLLSSCTDQGLAYSDNELHLEKIVDSNLDVDLSSLGYSLTKIPLILPDSSSLSGNTHVIYVSQRDSSLFASNGKHIYRFGKNGILKNKIGIIGQGPVEYQNIFSATFDSEEKMAYIYAGNNKINVYTFDGIPCKSVELQSNGYIGGAYRIKEGYWAESLDYNEDTTTISLIRFDNNGKKTDEHIITSFESKYGPDYYPSPIVYQYDNLQYSYYCPYNSQLYNVGHKEIKGVLSIDGGKYAFTDNQINDMDYRSSNRDKFVEILDIYQNDASIFILYTIDRKIYGGIVDKTSGKCVLNFQTGNPIRGGGVRIDKKAEIKTWPQYVDSHNIYSICFCESENLSDYSDTEESLLLILNKASTRLSD